MESICKFFLSKAQFFSKGFNSIIQVFTSYLIFRVYNNNVRMSTKKFLTNVRMGTIIVL
uniref:Uncharacterized protein n=1 Tax=Siphoviridae sp. ctWDo30 TaxID=2826360 RepID=A0A8S5N4Z7_9CAUD|nr:MAG TPA: hypothetical protein [Siphoviridae sp. ctWDo30]